MLPLNVVEERHCTFELVGKRVDVRGVLFLSEKHIAVFRGLDGPAKDLVCEIGLSRSAFMALRIGARTYLRCSQMFSGEWLVPNPISGFLSELHPIAVAS